MSNPDSPDRTNSPDTPSGNAKWASLDPTHARQRARLLDAIVQLTARFGYTQARVGDLASAAGVSRATFYDQFANKEECFLAAHDELALQLLATTAEALSTDPNRPTMAIVAALGDCAAKQPDRFSFLTYEAMVAGPAALDRRERLVATLAQQLDSALADAGDRSMRLEVPGWILLGGLIRVFGMRARRQLPLSRELLAELIAWIACYEESAERVHVPSHARQAILLDIGVGTSPGLTAPQPLPRGRHRLPAAVVKRVQRERILYATAQVIRTKGYPNTTVADVVAEAGVSREVFYSHFHNRSEAFIETHRLVFENMMAATAGAFFASPGPWPEQVWQSARASTKFVIDAPGYAYFAFVESYALGSAVAVRTDDAVLAFTALMTGGYSLRAENSGLPHSYSDAIVGAIMETVAHYVRAERPDELADLLPVLAHLILAPFTGAEAARTFIKDKLTGVA